MRAHFLALTVAFLAMIPAVPASAANPTSARAVAAAAPASSPIKDEHVRPVNGTLHANAIPDQMPGWAQPGAPASATRSRLATASNPNAFLTLPYVGWHSTTSVFDHC